MLHRLTDWPEAFAAALAHAQNKPFAWGENDCCLFAANCVLAITGVDLAAHFRGYQTETEARGIIARYGDLRNLAKVVMRARGIPEISPLQARRGDVCLLEGGNGLTLGICIGDKLVAPGKESLAGFAITKGLHAWGIG